MMTSLRTFFRSFAFAALPAIGLAAQSPLGDLIPEPQRVEARAGFAGKDALASVREIDGPVADAPAAVADEAYVLEVAPDGVTVTATARAGRLNARKTLAQLVKLADGRVPCCRITDWPFVKWRGCMIDTARNFLDLESVRDLIDVMAAYKLNLFHWHLTEYYAWRLESRKYPRLSKEGFHDPFGNRSAGKIYTQEEFRGIVDYAWERGVTVMPEFDVPGHTYAFRKAFGFVTMADPGVKETVCDLLEELCALAPKERMPFVHIGGDEVWSKEEKVAPETMSAWAEVLRRNGRTVVSWNPGEDFRTGGDRVSMLWSMNRAETVPTGDHPMFDACGWYIEDFEPFELLGAAAYSRPFQGHGPDPRQLGAIFCGWHDSAVGLPHRRLLAQQQVLPACLLLGDSFWHGREHVEDFTRRKLPSPGDPRLAVAADLERRVALHRDRVLDCPGQAFHFLRQTQMRWRLSETDGTLIAKDVPQASVFPYYGEGRRQNRYHSPTGTVVAETWILSPDDRTVGAWIGFTGYDRDNGRFRTKGTPALGEWNRFGATIELNGERIPPPVWKQPSMDAGKVIKAFTYAREIDEIPYTNDEYYMREPTEVRLRKGWNHVRMVLPMPVKADTWRSPRWVGTFIPVAGTTDRPRDVEDLRYSSEPPRHILVRDFRTVKDGQVVSFNIGTAAHGPATLAVLQKHLPGVKLSLWADAPLASELQRMMDRRFPDVKIHTGPDVPETDAELLLVGSGASIAGSVRRSIGPWRERTGRPVAAYAIGYGKGIAELTRAMSFCSFRDRTALTRAQGDRAAPAATGFAPDAVFDFDAADETGAAAFLKENGLEPGRFVCAIPGQRATSYWIYFGGKRDEKRETLNARHELPDNAIVCAAIVEAVRKHGLKVLLCAEHRGEMPLIERALLAQLPEDVKASCVPLREFWSPDLALGVYRRSRCVFGIEMHSQVMAIGNGVPAVVMRHSGFGSKSGMWNDVGLGEWLMDIDDAGAAERAAAIVGGILSDEAAAKAKVVAARAAIDAAAADAVRRLAAVGAVRTSAQDRDEAMYGGFRRLQYNTAGTSDLKSGLFSWPMVMDYDGDGDLDVLISTAGIPTWRGTWLFENTGRKGDLHPVFRKARRVHDVGGLSASAQVLADGRLAVTQAGLVTFDYRQNGMRNARKFAGLPRNVHTNDVRGNVWRFADLNGDGKEDLVIGVGDWKDYGWHNSWDEAGEWRSGPLHGLIYYAQNETGADGVEKWGAPSVLRLANGKPIDVAGYVSPLFADWDGDGDLDLLTCDFGDSYTYFENIGTKEVPRFATGRPILDKFLKPVKADLCMVTATVADWDGDGRPDLITCEEDARICLYRNTGRTALGLPVFDDPYRFRQERAEVGFGILATPSVIDWDGDGDQDIITGNSAGYVAFIENLSGPAVANPQWAEPKLLSADGAPIRIIAGPNGSIQGPCEEKWGYTCLSTGDWDGDGLPDIMLNSIRGEILWCRNVGTRTNPELAPPEPVAAEWEGPQPELAWGWMKPNGSRNILTQWRTTPYMIDLDEDGLMDLVMLDVEGYLCLWRRAQREGKRVLLPPERCLVDERGQPIQLAGQDTHAGPKKNYAGGSGRRKFCFVDWTRDGKRDLVCNSRNVLLYEFLKKDGGKWYFAKRGDLDDAVLAGHTTSPAACDFDGNGIGDLLVGAEDGFFYLLTNRHR